MLDYSLPLSTNVTVALLNKWAVKSQDDICASVKLQKMDIVICRILDFIFELRNETLLANALQYMVNTNDNTTDKKLLLANLVQGKEAIFPGTGFKKMFQSLIDDFETSYADFLRNDGRALLEKKTIPEIKEIERLTLFDHLILINNRIPDEDKEGRYMAFEVTMHLLKEKTSFMKGLDLMILLKNNKEQARAAKLNKLLNLTLLPEFQDFSVNKQNYLIAMCSMPS